MKWIVLCFYPNLGIKVRITEYDSQVEMYEYVNACIMCETPYLVLRDGKVVDINEFDLTREQMAEMVEKYT